jgi:hypothetical protein
MSLPAATNWGQYLYYNATTWAIGSTNVTIGNNAGYTSQGTLAVAIGNNAGAYSQGTFAVSVGGNAGYTNQGTYAVSIGYLAAGNNQQQAAIAIGTSAGAASQGRNAIAIGNNAGFSSQNTQAIAIGVSAGAYTQRGNTVAIGYQAGQTSQYTAAIAIGYQAGASSQGTSAIAIGLSAGFNSQSISAIAIGLNAGYTGQGSNSIAIGEMAGYTIQPANSIVINASGNNLNGATASACYINPIRNAGATAGVLGGMYYNNFTNEVLYATSKTFVIDHPVEQDKYLVHACMEGPEAGVYYRGTSEIKNGTKVVVKLPDYVNKLANDFTVNVTSIDKPVLLCASEVIDNTFTVMSDSITTCKFNWFVFGSRGVVEVEPKKNNVVVHGQGPYKWIG